MLYVGPPSLLEWLPTALDRISHSTGVQPRASTTFHAGMAKTIRKPSPATRKTAKKAAMQPGDWVNFALWEIDFPLADGSLAPWVASSSACHSAASVTRPRSAAIAEPTSARSPVKSSK